MQAKDEKKGQKKPNGNGVVTEYLGLKIPRSMLKAIEEYVSRDTHMSKSDFARSAIREKLEKSDILDEMLENNKSGGK